MFVTVFSPPPSSSSDVSYNEDWSREIERIALACAFNFNFHGQTIEMKLQAARIHGNWFNLMAKLIHLFWFVENNNNDRTNEKKDECYSWRKTQKAENRKKIDFHIRQNAHWIQIDSMYTLHTQTNILYYDKVKIVCVVIVYRQILHAKLSTYLHTKQHQPKYTTKRKKI